MLNKDFEKTFWTDPETGTTHFFHSRATDTERESLTSHFLRGQNALDEIEARNGLRFKDGSETPRLVTPVGSIPKGEPIPEQFSGYQGLFVHPMSGTGLKEDPLVPIEQRTKSAERMIGASDVSEYGLNRALAGITSKDSIARREADRQAVVKATVNSGIPTHVMDQIPRVPVVIQPAMKSQGGHYMPNNGRPADGHYIRVNQTGGNRVVGRTPVVESTRAIPGEPIPNPKVSEFANDLKEMAWKPGGPEWNYKNRDALREKVGTKFNIDGENWSVKVPASPEFSARWGGKTRISTSSYLIKDDVNTDQFWSPKHEDSANPDKITGYDIDFEKLHAHPGVMQDPFTRHDGHLIDPEVSQAAGLNLYPGHSKGGPDFTATNFTINKVKMHTRQAVAGTETVTTGGEPIKEYVPKASTSTIVHEIGHSVDQPGVNYHSTDQKEFADPVNEGHADGYRDRYQTHAYMPEGALDTQTYKRSALGIGFGSGGYGAKHWERPLHQAVYVASRVHVANGGSTFASSALGGLGGDVTHRQTLMQNTGTNGVQGYMNSGSDPKAWAKAGRDAQTHVHTMTLGHLYQTNPKVREAFAGTHLEGVAKDAAAKYSAHVTDAANQPTLFD